MKHFGTAILLACASSLISCNEATIKTVTDGNQDMTSPSAPSAVVDGNVATSASAAPVLSWSASPSASAAGFAGYEIALGTAAGLSDVLSWTNVGNVTSYTPAVGFTLVDGYVYYASVRAAKTNGFKSNVSTGDGFVVNTSATTFSCEFTVGTSTDCFAAPYTSVARPLLQLYRSGVANSSPGTYVDPNGLIRVATTNLLTNSENYATLWGSFQATTSASATTAPDGSANGSKLLETTNNSQHFLYKSRTGSNETLTFSIYAKAAERSYVLLQLSNLASDAANATFNLTTCTVNAASANSSDYSNTSATARSVGNDWCRISITSTKGSANTTNVPSISPMFNSAVSSYVGVATSGIYLWGAQLESGAEVTPYTYTGANISYGPRLDHDPTSCTGGVCARKGLLIENTSGNSLLRSGDLSHAAFSRANFVTVTANTAVAPDGTTTAATVSDAVNDYAILQQSATAGNAQTWTASVYLKKDTDQSRVVMLQLQYGGGAPNLWYQMYINTVTGAFQLNGTTKGGVADAGDYWRAYLTGTNNSVGNTLVYWGLYPAFGPALGTGSTASTGSVVAWGAQLEQFPVPTSYIPTTTTALTRYADNAQTTNLSGWYATGLGTVVSEFSVPYVGSTIWPWIWSFDDGGSTNRIGTFLDDPGPDKLSFKSTNSGSNDGNVWTVGSAITTNVSAKSAFGFNANDLSASVGGSAVSTDSTVIIPTVTTFSLGRGDSPLNGHLKTIKYFNQRLSDTKLQYLSK